MVSNSCCWFVNGVTMKKLLKFLEGWLIPEKCPECGKRRWRKGWMVCPDCMGRLDII